MYLCRLEAHSCLHKVHTINYAQGDWFVPKLTFTLPKCTRRYYISRNLFPIIWMYLLGPAREYNDERKFWDLFMYRSFYRPHFYNECMCVNDCIWILAVISARDKLEIYNLRLVKCEISLRSRTYTFRWLNIRIRSLFSFAAVYTAPLSHFVRHKRKQQQHYTYLGAWFRKSRCSGDQLHMHLIIMALGTGRLYPRRAGSLKQRPADNVPSELRNLIWSRAL